MDQVLPVIEMEQLRPAFTDLQSYRIRIFSDGQVEYAGLQDVKQVGLVNFTITPDQVLGLLAEFRRLKFWSVRENQFSDALRGPLLARTFTVREGASFKTVRFGGNSHGRVLREVIEDVVGSSRFRCPFIGKHDLDLCPSQDVTDRDYFYRIVFPKLAAEYK